ncbi:hypothetical protein P5V15_012535 [Pogonomyrmex californicus]
MKVDPNSAWQYFTKDETFKAKCTVCDKQIKAYALPKLEHHLHSHKKIIKNIQEEIKSAWLFKYFTFVDEQKKVKCSRCDNKLSIFLGTEGLEQHMLLHNINQSSETTDMKSHLYYHHKESNPKEDEKWRTMKVDPNSAWRYYTKDETFRAKCNICEKIMKKGYVLKNLERHLITYHKQIIKNIQEDIKSSWLFKYLTFVDKQNEIKCSRCDDKLSIFLGTEGLKLHMLDHNIKMKRHLYYHHEESNPKEDEKWRTMKVDPNSAWRYFTKDEIFKAKCNVCKKIVKNADLLWVLESHLIHCHQTIIKNIQEKIKSSWLFKYLTFVEEQKKVKCSRCDDKLSIFLGTEGLKLHMLHHNITHLYHDHKIFNDEEDKKWKTMVVDPNSAWRYYRKETFIAKCKVCGDPKMSACDLRNLERHLCRHKETMQKIQEEIKASWLFKYLTFVDKQNEIKCNCCDEKLNIFLGTEGLKLHMLRHNIKTNPSTEQTNTPTVIQEVPENNSGKFPMILSQIT